MTYKNCTCNPLQVVSSVIGDRYHINDERGEWCAIVNKSGIYLQNLLIPSAEELAKEQEHQQKILTEQAAESAKEARRQELKNKLDSGETLTSLEIMELLRLTL